MVVRAFCAAAALPEALQRRMRGERFDVRFELVDDRTAIAAALCEAIVAKHHDAAARRAALDALGARTLTVQGRPQRDATSRTPTERAAAREIATLASRVIVRSHAEADDVASFAAVNRAKITMVEPHVSTVARKPGVRGEHAVVDARGVRAEITALVMHALHDEHPILVQRDDHPALDSARAVLVADPFDPSSALGLAPLGVPLAVAATSGAREYLDPLSVYDPWDPRSIRAALRAARDGVAPRVRRGTSSVPPQRSHPIVRHEPLVSIVVRTRDRPQFLARALASIAAQTYRAVETIVVVDGGAPVDHVLAAFPGVQSIVHAQSLGPIPALIAGMRAATGDHLSMLDDDDVLFPDHLERVMDALVQARARAAHSIAATLFARAESQTYRIFGMNTALRRVPRPDRIHLEYGIAPMTLVVRRDAFEAAGGYDPAIAHAEDWDFVIRLTQNDDIVFVPEVTAAYTVRPEEAGSLVQTGGARIIATQQYLMEKYPLAGRPYLAAQRRDLAARTAASAGTARFPDPVAVQGGVLW